MKKLFLVFNFLLLLACTAMVHSQTMEYSYDNAGNRRTRQVVILAPLVASPSMAKKYNEDPATEKLGERIIKVYPNPTKGALAIEITGGDEKDKVEMQLFSGQGVQLQTMQLEIGKTPIDMLTYPAGWYILRLGTGDKIKEIKIIKQ